MIEETYLINRLNRIVEKITKIDLWADSYLESLRLKRQCEEIEISMFFREIDQAVAKVNQT